MWVKLIEDIPLRFANFKHQAFDRFPSSQLAISICIVRTSFSNKICPVKIKAIKRLFSDLKYKTTAYGIVFDFSIKFHFAVRYSQIVFVFGDIYFLIAFEAYTFRLAGAFRWKAKHCQSCFGLFIFLIQYTAHVGSPGHNDDTVFQNRKFDHCFGETFRCNTTYRRHLAIRW